VSVSCRLQNTAGEFTAKIPRQRPQSARFRFAVHSDTKGELQATLWQKWSHCGGLRPARVAGDCVPSGQSQNRNLNLAKGSSREARIFRDHEKFVLPLFPDKGKRSRVWRAPQIRTCKRRREKLAVHPHKKSVHRGIIDVSRQNQMTYGAWAAIAPMSAMLSPFLRDGTALMCKMTPEIGARTSSMTLPK
jgi:hypothetical protein